MKIDELRDRNDEIKGRLNEIQAENQGNALPEEARSEWNDLNSEYDKNVELISEFEAREERLASLSGNEGTRESGAHFHTRSPNATRNEDIYDLTTVQASVANPDAAARELKDRAKRSIERSTFPGVGSREVAQEHVENLVDTIDGQNAALSAHILRTGSPEYKRAFGKALAGQVLSREEERSLSLTGENGGFAVPYTLDPTVLPTSNGVVNPLRSISRTEQITGNTWKGVTSSGVTAAYAAEVTEASDNAPTLVQPEVSVAKAQAFVPFSIEVGQDWSGLQGEISVMLADAKDKLEAEKFLSGSGANVPQGVLTGATELVETATEKTFAVKDVYAVEAALPPRFRPNAQWTANRAVYSAMREFDTAGGASYWLGLKEGLDNNRGGNVGMQLVGYKANELSTMAATPATQGAKTLVLGDFSYFIIVDRIGMSVELIPHLFGENRRPTGQRGLYAYWRNGSKVLSANAFRVLKVK